MPIISKICKECHNEFFGERWYIKKRQFCSCKCCFKNLDFRKQRSLAHTGKRLSEEHKRSIGKTGIGRKAWNRGVPHTEETKEKMRLAWERRRREGRDKFTKEHRRKISEALIRNNGFRGKHHSEESKANISKNLRGSKNGMFGRHHSEETLNKIRKKRAEQVIPTKDTSIEVVMQNELKKRNIIFEKHSVVLNYFQPDIVFPEKKIAIFCDGDYWHNYPEGTNRDRYVDERLKREDWISLRFWGHEINESVSKCVDVIEANM